jgi:hypothetical protein
MTINKLNKKQFLPIRAKEIRLLLSYYWGWYKTYDKDCYKYVIEQLELKEDLKNKYYDDILSSLHNFIKGGKFYRIEITK